MAIMMTPRERKPTSIFEALSRLRRKSPAAQSRMSESGDLRDDEKAAQAPARPGRASASSPLSALGISGREALHAGAKPQMKPAKRLRRKEYRTTRQSTLTEISTEMGTGRRKEESA